MDRNSWDTPLRCCLAKQTPLPSPPLTQSAETLTGGPARNLYWQAATTNQSTEGMPGSCMHILRKIPSCCRLAFQLISNMKIWTLWFNVNIAGWVKHMTGLLPRLHGKSYLFELPAIRHRGHHLCQLLLLALQHPIHMLYWNLERKKNTLMGLNGKICNLRVRLTFCKHKNCCTCVSNLQKLFTEAEIDVPVMFCSPVPWSCPWWVLLMMWCYRIQLPLRRLKNKDILFQTEILVRSTFHLWLILNWVKRSQNTY